jgi:Uma2 family endonuclease
MVATSDDLMVLNEKQFDLLPDDGIFEVVNGRAILMPGNDAPHQQISFALAKAIDQQLTPATGYFFQAINVHVAPDPIDVGAFCNRVPDLAVSTFHPGKKFQIGRPPELVIEILSTPRGNVERTEKLDDYARAGILEYWIVNPFGSNIEVYYLQNGDYQLQPQQTRLRPLAFPTVAISVAEIFPKIPS